MLSMLGSPRKERPRSIHQHLSAEHKLPNLSPKFLFTQYKESNPVLTNQQEANINSLFVFTLLQRNLSPCTVFQSSFLCARLDAAQFTNHWVRAYQINKFSMKKFVLKWENSQQECSRARLQRNFKLGSRGKGKT